jgi:hypothetical protein
MKRRWRAAAFGTMTLIAVFAATFYVLYLERQTAAMLATRKPSEAVDRYARIQKAIKPTATIQSAEVPVAEWPPRVPEANPEDAELLQPIQQAAAYTSGFRSTEPGIRWKRIFFRDPFPLGRQRIGSA